MKNNYYSSSIADSLQQFWFFLLLISGALLTLLAHINGSAITASLYFSGADQLGSIVNGLVYVFSNYLLPLAILSIIFIVWSRWKTDRHSLILPLIYILMTLTVMIIILSSSSSLISNINVSETVSHDPLGR